MSLLNAENFTIKQIYWGLYIYIDTWNTYPASEGLIHVYLVDYQSNMCINSSMLKLH